MAVDEVLGIEYMEENERSPHIFFRDFVNRVGAMFRGVLDKDLGTPDPTPADGDMYIVPSGATGAWSGHTDELTRWDEAANAWLFTTPRGGWQAWVIDETDFYAYDGADWVPIQTLFTTGAGDIVSAGVNGGQIINGGTAAGDDLELFSTSHGTKGNIHIGTGSTYSQVNDNLGIGTRTPDADAEIEVARTGENSTFETSAYGTGFAGRFKARAARGTAGSPTASQLNDILGQMAMLGYGATGFAADTTARIRARAAENFTDIAMGTLLELMVTPIGSVTAAVAATLSSLGLTLEVPLIAKEIAAPATPASGYVSVYAKSDGKIYRKDDAGTEAELGGGGGGAMEVISTYVVATTDPYIEWSSIVGTYEDLEILLMGRMNEATTVNVMRMKFNSDGGANYYRQHISASGTSISTGDEVGATSFFAGYLPGSTANANEPAINRIRIPSYARTVFNKQFLTSYYVKWSNSSSGQNTGQLGGAWNSNVAITTVRLYPISGSFIAGTRATLYGIKG